MKQTLLKMFVLVVVLTAAGTAIPGLRKPASQPALLANVTSPGTPPATIELPMTFEPNRGQAGAEVQFVSRGKDRTLFLTAGEAVLSLVTPSSNVREAVVQMKWQNAARPVIEGLDPHPGTSNYLHGTDTSKWITGVPNYARVRYRGVYPGTDLLFYGNEGQLEYDFVLAPGADPRRIRLAFKGVDRMRVDASGDLLLKTPGGELRQHRPRVYQESEGGRVEIAGDYRLLGRNQVGFEVGAYDRERQLVIDPVLSFSTYLGTDVAYSKAAIAVDTDGNAYLTGQTGPLPFPITATSYQPVFKGGLADCFVTKLSPAGALLYSTYLGGSKTDEGLAIAVDEYRNVYVTGNTHSPDFPTSQGAFQSFLNGFPLSDVFVTKLNAGGNILVYSTYIGGSDMDMARAIALLKTTVPGGTGSPPQYFAYVTGETRSSDFPTTPGAIKTNGNASLNNSDAFVVKVNPKATALSYSTYLGGSTSDSAEGIAVNALGYAYVAGRTTSADFYPPPQAYQTTLRGVADAFVVKLYPNGSFYTFSTYLGGSQGDGAAAITIDPNDDDAVYLAGGTVSADFPITPGAFQTALGDAIHGDAFVTKMDGGKGTFLYYSTYLGHDGWDTALGIAVDGFKSAHVTGHSQSTAFPTTANALRPVNTSAILSDGYPAEDGFLTRLDATGSGLLYSTLLGGSAFDRGQSIALHVIPACPACKAKVAAYVSGLTTSVDFPTTSGVVQPQKQGANFNVNAFALRIIY